MEVKKNIFYDWIQTLPRETLNIAKSRNDNSFKKEFALHASTALLHIVKNYVYLVTTY